eukprot:gene13730-16192_t
MSKYFEQEINPKELQGKRIIELGSGVGLLGITISLLGANIVLTDQKCMHDILDLNVRTNCNTQIRSQKTKVTELWWGNDVTDLRPPYDMIVGSDLMYDDDCVDLLLASLLDLSSFHPKKKETDDDDSVTTDDLEQQFGDIALDGNQTEEDVKKEEIVDETTLLLLEEAKAKQLEEPLYVKSALLQPADTVIYLGFEFRQMTAESIFMNKVETYFDVEVNSQDDKEA